MTMGSTVLKQPSNLLLAIFGVAALLHSILHFGSGTLPEAILALLLFLKAFAGRKQPWSVAITGLLAAVLTWIANSNVLASDHLRMTLSWVGIGLFGVLAFSRFIFEKSKMG